MTLKADTKKLRADSKKLRADRKEFWFAVLVTVIGLGAVLPGQEPVKAAGTAQGFAAVSETAAPVAVKRLVLVSLVDRKLALIEDGEVKVVYTVAVGKGSTPSPVGAFTIVSHAANPTYTHKGKVVGPGPGNPVGTRWMGLSVKGYGIHGTNVQSSIGKATSHGCIRVGRKDLEALFKMVQVGDAVEIRGERDEETAAVFGTAADGDSGVTVAAAAAPAPAMQGQE